MRADHDGFIGLARDGGDDAGLTPFMLEHSHRGAIFIRTGGVHGRVDLAIEPFRRRSPGRGFVIAGMENCEGF